MGQVTGIEWTDSTWNPIRGCSRVSEGCRNCYAERVAARFSGTGMPYEGLAEMTAAGPRWTGEVRLIEKHLNDPLHWKKPRRIFVNSMSDLFHEMLTDDQIDRVFDVMKRAKHHVFQILTKRPQLALDYIRRRQVGAMEGGMCVLPPNIWMGISSEDQPTANDRIPILLDIPAQVRWVSAEPLIGPLTFQPESGCYSWLEKTTAAYVTLDERTHPLRHIDWVVVGGESGAGHRPMDPRWVRRIRSECILKGTPFFFKQWGGLRGKDGGKVLDGRTWCEFPT